MTEEQDIAFEAVWASLQTRIGEYKGSLAIRLGSLFEMPIDNLIEYDVKGKRELGRFESGGKTYRYEITSTDKELVEEN